MDEPIFSAILVDDEPLALEGLKLRLEKIPQKEDGEEDMLDFAFEVKDNSRLSCQVTVNDDLDGLIVNIPEKQF